MRITQKSILSHLLASLLPMAVFFALSYTAVHRYMQQSMSDQLAAAADEALGVVVRSLVELQRDVGAWAQAVTMQDVLVDDGYGDIQRDLQEITRRYPSVDALVVTNQTGHVVASTAANVVSGADLGDGDFFYAAVARGSWMGRVAPQAATGRPGLPLAVAIHANYDRSKVIGVLLVIADWQALAREIQDIDIYGQAQDSARRILLLSGSELVHGALPGVSGVDLAGLQQQATAGLVDLAGGETFVARSHTAQAAPIPLSAFAVISEQVVAQAMTRFSHLAGAVAVFGGLATALLGHLAALHLARPVTEVTAQLNRVAAGETDVPISFAGRDDEIGDMGRALAVFRDNLATMQRLATEKAEAESHARQVLSAALEALEQPLAVWDAEGRFVLGNRAFEDLMETFGIPVAALADYSFRDIEVGLLQVGMLDLSGSERRVARDGRSEMDVTLTDGRVLRLLEQATADGGTVSAWYDITGFRRRETALSMLANENSGGRAYAETAVEALALGLGMRRAGVTRLSPDGATLDVVALWDGERRLPSFSYPVAGSVCHNVLAGRGPFVLEDRALERFGTFLPLSDLPGRSYVGLPYRGADGNTAGHVFAIGDQPIALSADDKQFLWVIGRWVEAQHERAKAVEQLTYQANYDPLTGLPNRHLALDRLGLALARARRYGNQAAALFIDLDNFKTVNDTLGHMIGDELLRLASQRLAHCLREEDTVARLGGDEFLVILPSLPEDRRADVVARKVIEAFAQPFTVHGYELFVTASIGITVYPSDGETPTEILRNADAAMYLAKERGRNSWQYFTPRLNERANQRLLIESRLRHALERGELYLCYHPLIDIRSGRLLAAEALIRWNNPELGLVPPDRFIPIAEETDMIVGIGRFVIETACRDLANWRVAGIEDVRVAVNVSSRQFDDGLVETVAQALQQNRIDPDRLELEITERLLLKQDNRTAEVLDKLRTIGVRFSIDDFGTGYSAMSYLTAFPLDVLKIDRSFVRNAAQSSQDAKLAHAIIAMAHSLNLEVVGEGVEEQSDLDFLRRHGCDLAQGFYYAKPLPCDQFIAWAHQFVAAAPEADAVFAAQ